MAMQKIPTWILLIGIIVIAIIFRFWQLDSVPPGLYPDEAIYANDGLTAARTGDFKTYYPNNNGREGFYISLLGIILNIFGAHIWVIRAFVGVIGVGTVFGIWFLAKQLFENDRIALFSAFFAATGFWVVNFSRIGFRATLVPFLIAFSFAFLWRGLKRLTARDFIFAGIFFGLGFHTYIAFRFAPFILLALLATYWWEKRKTSTAPCNACLKIALFLFITFIVALPIGWYYLNNPQDFFGRAAGVSIFSTDQPLKEFIWGTIKTLGQFNIIGDYNWRHNFSGKPLLLYPVGFVFLWGIILSIIKIIKRKTLIYERHELSAYFFLIVGFIFMMFPSTLTAEGLPHALRTIGMIPFVMIFAGIGAESLYQRFVIWSKEKRMSEISLRTIIALIIIAITVIEFHKYFIVWAQKTETKDAFSHYFVQIGYSLREMPETLNKYIVVNQDGTLVNGIPVPAETVKFVADKVANTYYILPEHLSSLIPKTPFVIIPLHFNKEIQTTIQKQFLQLNIQQNNKGIYIFN